MSRYIDADNLKDLITELDEGCANEGIGFDIYTCEVFELIEQVPTADVRENVKGLWDADQGQWGFYRCTECNNMSKTKHNFCPNCGADMRL